MLKEFAISAATAAFMTVSAHAQTIETHHMDNAADTLISADIIEAVTQAAEQSRAENSNDACPLDTPVGKLTEEQRRACLGNNETPQPDPFVVRLHGGVTEASAKAIIEDLLEFAQEDPTRQIDFYINSGGGLTVQSMAIYDTMMTIPNDIRTICEGRSMSAGHLLLTAGTPGLRDAYPNCDIMGHQMSGGASGTMDDTRLSSEYMERLNDKHIGIIARHSGWDTGTMRDIMSHNVYISPQEAQDLGFIDNIIQPSKPVPAEGTKDRDDIPAWLCEGQRAQSIRACVGLDFD